MIAGMNEKRDQFRKLRDVAKLACEEKIKEARTNLKRQVEEINRLEIEILGRVEKVQPEDFAAKQPGAQKWGSLPLAR